jgi:hypothetical protein
MFVGGQRSRNSDKPYLVHGEPTPFLAVSASGLLVNCLPGAIKWQNDAECSRTILPGFPLKDLFHNPQCFGSLRVYSILL